MLRSVKKLFEHKLGASDGEIGHVKDLYFDDRSWVVRYLVANTGSWLSGRLVLLSPYAFGDLPQGGKVLVVNLTRQQIENSPSIESHKPVLKPEKSTTFDWLEADDRASFQPAHA